MIQRILLPTDGSEYAEKTIEMAITLAKKLDAMVIVMYAYDALKPLRKRSSMLTDDVRHSMEKEATELVQEVAARLQAQELTVQALAVEGHPAEAILRAIQAESPDLVVMGARGEGGFVGLMMGSVAENVVRHSPVPVLVVK